MRECIHVHCTRGDTSEPAKGAVEINFQRNLLFFPLEIGRHNADPECLVGQAGQPIRKMAQLGHCFVILMIE